MSLNNPRTDSLPETVAALGATVECFARFPDNFLSDPYYATVREAKEADEVAFTYGGTTFPLYRGEDGLLTKISVTVALGEPLPKAFADGILQLSFIIVTCPVPETVIPRPGWYVGLNYGFPYGACSVDPDGSRTNEAGIYANGAPNTNYNDDEDGLKDFKVKNSMLFDSVTGLFIGVMSGRVEHNGDDSGIIHYND